MSHAFKTLRGLDGTAHSSIETGRFGRMFRWLPPAFAPASSTEDIEVESLVERLGRLMVSNEFNDRVDCDNEETPDIDILTPEEEDENRAVPAGYTYLGQFIDHDITFDPASSLQQQNDPDALEDFRTPRLDLDSVYGRGPDDQPYLYERASGRTRFRLGPNRGVGGQERPDLLRSDDETALIADKRNDENKIVRQFHALLQRFHNKVYDELKRAGAPSDPQARFREAQRIVRWTYQWLVVHDYLPRVCMREVVESVLPARPGEEPRLRFYRPHSGEAFMPVEFSAAAFRFGHSMVRPSYLLNDGTESTARFTSKQGKVRKFSRVPIFVPVAQAPKDALNGFGEPLPDGWGIDWSFFFGEIPEATQDVKQTPQPSYRIDATLVDPLGALPEFAPVVGVDSPFASLAIRNLLRGFRMGLPSGQSVARMMGEGVLTDEELWHYRIEGDRTEWDDGKKLLLANPRWLKGSAPLWFYILKEAEMVEHGQRLGAVGSRIVAETLVGLLWCDHFSYLFQAPGWDPACENSAGLPEKLDMLKLTQFVG